MFAPASLLPPLIGYALLCNVASNRRECGYRLQFDDCTFDHFLACSRDDVFAVIDHRQRRYEIASTARGSLLLDSDSRGLFCIILPRNGHEGRIAVSLVAGGHACSMSVHVAHLPEHAKHIADGIMAVSRARIVEVSGVHCGAIPGTTLRVADHPQVPRTIEELLAEECRLRAANLNHAQAGTLLSWKVRKASRRARLLESLSLANAG